MEPCFKTDESALMKLLENKNSSHFNLKQRPSEFPDMAINIQQCFIVYINITYTYIFIYVQ